MLFKQPYAIKTWEISFDNKLENENENCNISLLNQKFTLKATHKNIIISIVSVKEAYEKLMIS